MREREIEKITIQRGVTREELRAFIFELRRRARPRCRWPTGCSRKGSRRIVLGRLSIETGRRTTGHRHRRGAQGLRHGGRDGRAALAGGQGGREAGPGAARKIIDSLAKLVGGDRTSLMALTALKKYDNYTFTHMVNVSVLAMAQARSLNIDGTLLREFGFAALMHDIGKVQTPQEVLNKPGKLVEGRVRHHEAARRRRRAHPAADAGDAGAGADRRLRAPPAAGSVRISGEHRAPQAEPVHADRQHRGRLRRAAQQPRLPRGDGERPHQGDHGEEGRPGVQPAAAAAVHQPDRPVSGRDAGAAEHRGDRRGHARAPDRSVPAAGEDRARPGRRRHGRTACW